MAEMAVRIEGVTPNGGALPIVGTLTPPFRVSVAGGASAAAPTAGTAVITIASGSLPSGLYRVEVTIGMSGTLAAGDLNNMEFRVGAAVVCKGMTYTSTTNNGNPTAKYTFQVAPDGTQAMSVNATANATASSVYSASIIATQVN